MQFAPKLLLTTLICTTGAQLTHCSQAQSSSAITTQAAPSARSQEQARLAQAAVQAAVAQLQRTSTQGTTQTTGQEIVERDAKRVKLSAAEEKQTAEKRERNWLLSYKQKLSPEAEKKLEEAKIEAIEKERGTILPTILYDILDPMPIELINMIASYDEPYHLKGELVQTLKPPLPKDVTITAITPLLVPHGTMLIVGYSHGYLQILRTDKALAQTIQADKSAVTTIADLKDQKFATGATSGDLKIWSIKPNTKEYSCDTTIATGIPIKKIATLSNGNIVVGGTVGERSGQWQIWDPVTRKKLYSCEVNDGFNNSPFIDLLVLPDDRIMVNCSYQDSVIYKQTKTNTWATEMIEAPTFCHHLVSLTLLSNNDILRCGLSSSPQMHILDHDNYDRCSLVLEVDEVGGEESGPLTILSDGNLAVDVSNEVEDSETNDTHNIKIFDMSNTRYQLNLMNDNILAIPLSDYKSELQYLITLPDGRLLGAFKDGTISIWR